MMKTLIKWTVEDYHRLIKTGILRDRPIELIEGDLISMSPEGPIHTYVTEGLTQYLRQSLTGIAVVREAHPITLVNSEPQPDIAIVKPPRATYRQRHPYPEDIYWLIEISQSTLNYDLNEKKRIYAEANIQEYWVIDVNQQQVYVFRTPQQQDYTSQSIIVEGNITPLAFPELQLSLQKFWQD